MINYKYFTKQFIFGLPSIGASSLSVGIASTEGLQQYYLYS